MCDHCLYFRVYIEVVIITLITIIISDTVGPQKKIHQDIEHDDILHESYFIIISNKNKLYN